MVVRAGKDPITGKYSKLTETCATRDVAERVLERLVTLVEADQAPDRSATLSVLLDRWLDVAELELSTRETTVGYIRPSVILGAASRARSASVCRWWLSSVVRPAR